MTVFAMYGHGIDDYMLTKVVGVIRCPGIGDRPPRIRHDCRERLSDVVRCPGCGVALNKYDLDYSDVTLRMGRWDVSTTYDGFTMVSPRFAAICAEHGFKGYDLKPLKEGGFVFLARPILQVDQERSKMVRNGLRFAEYCETCKRYNSVACGTPLFLQEGQDVAADSFYRTDMVFAWRDEQSPMELCGVEVANVLRKSKLRGPAFLKKDVSF